MPEAETRLSGRLSARCTTSLCTQASAAVREGNTSDQGPPELPALPPHPLIILPICSYRALSSPNPDPPNQ